MFNILFWILFSFVKSSLSQSRLFFCSPISSSGDKWPQVHVYMRTLHVHRRLLLFRQVMPIDFLHRRRPEEKKCSLFFSFYFPVRSRKILSPERVAKFKSVHVYVCTLAHMCTDVGCKNVACLFSRKSCQVFFLFPRLPLDTGTRSCTFPAFGGYFLSFLSFLG
jgi:hypothetical protein